MAVMKLPFATSRRDTSLSVPGVGAYNLSQSIDFTTKNHPRAKIGNSTRNAVNLSMMSIPGPADYSPNRAGEKKSPRATIGTSKREFFNKTMEFPGPQNYNTHKGMAKSKQHY